MLLKQSTHSVQSLKNTIIIFHRAGTNNPKICVEPEKTQKHQGNVEKEKQSWGNHVAEFQAILQSCDQKDSMVLAQKQTYRQMGQNRDSRHGPSARWATKLSKQEKTSSGKKTVS